MKSIDKFAYSTKIHFMKKVSIIAFLLAAFQSQGQIITTIAGTGAGAYTGDGIQATASALQSPYGVGMDSLGNIFIGDANNNRVRKINTSGIISTVAGTGVAGFNGDGLLATNTQLNFPYGMSVNRAGMIVIADRSNHRIRSIQTELGGVVTTIAGTGVAGFSGDGGLAIAAQINHPQGVFWDRFNNVFFCDDDNHRVRRIDGVTGIITTIAGTGTVSFSGDGGPATAATFNHPVGVTVDSADNMYIADYANHRIRKINPSGIISTICGNGSATFSGDGGPATAATVSYPKDIFADSRGNIIFTDAGNQRIRKINAAGIITTIAGNGSIGYSGDGGAATLAKLNWPQQIFVDTASNLYIGDCVNNRIRKVNCVPPTVSAIAGLDTVCIGSTITLTNSTAGGYWRSTNAHATISGGGVVAGVTAGLETIKYVVDNSCTSVQVFHTVYVSTCTTTNVPELTSNDLKVYPNPVTQELTVSCTHPINNLTIANFVGQIVYEHNYNTPLVTVNVSDLPTGLYFIKINNSSVSKFMKL